MQDPWKCEWCNKVFVVPSLARMCERNHIDYQEKEPFLGDH